MEREPVWRRYLRILGPEPASDVEDELQFHILTKADELVAGGMEPDEARREALRQFGPLGSVRNECYTRSRVQYARTRRYECFGGWLRDVRYAVRVLLKPKVSTATAVFILALGIGGNLAVFTFLDRLLYKPLPVPRPGELQLVSCKGYGRFPGGGDHFQIDCRYDAYGYLRERSKAFFALAAVGGFSVRERRGKEKIDRPAEVQSVSGNFFDVLETRARLGRALAPSDDAPNASLVAVASDRFWTRRYNRAADALGRVVYLNDLPFTIVGVLPRGFTGIYKGSDPDLYISLGTAPRVAGDDLFHSVGAYMFGRLRRGFTPRQAQSNLQAALAAYLADRDQPQIGRTRMEAAGARIECADGASGVAGAFPEQKRSLLLVGGITALLLLMASVNVACLLAARGAARQQEIAIRVSLGAGRARILRQLLLESVLLALAGGAAGLFAALGADRLLLSAFGWQERPLDLAPDWRVVGFGLAISLLTALLFGVFPAIQLARGRQVGLNQSRSAPGFGSGKALVVVEVALSLVTVAAAAVFIRSFQNLRSVPVGFSPESVSAITLVDANQDSGHLRAPFQEVEVLAESLRGAPGVESATVADLLTFGDGAIGFRLSIPGDPAQPGLIPNVLRVDGTYFDALRIPLIAGRAFTSRDDQHAPKVAILSEGLARRLFGSRNPLGRRIVGLHGPNPKPEDEAEIVGIVRDIKFRNVTSPAPSVVFVPLFQDPNIGAGSFQAELQVRSRMTPQAIAALVRSRIRAQHLPVEVEAAKSLERVIGASMLNDRIRMQASSLFGVIALLLIAAGVYGLMAYSVARRTREIGVRMAVGAEPSAIVRLVLRESLGLVAIGVVIGIPGAVAVIKAVGGMLFGLPPIDPVSLGCAVLALSLTATAASVTPAWRASHLDPVRALRVE